ncbi:PAS domain-containing protein [Aureimonas jatrophae]|uniref:histidine kinase n=1 Tax=Aureimonas jatrophae TaxID=1166073 RepID=A0A1H0K4T6_9HYPH|nr:PAS domain-containing protein [Aureimonas jatrophae]MBB3950947.1 PAS domain S-box-containing protein [Aureimonas jatrophae]SDO50919.1 PAS domain S-box-containing protein [Aureimonas jatrophae]
MPDAPARDVRESLRAAGDCGARIASRDWSTTALGTIESWPASLRTTLLLLLASPAPIALLWGLPSIVFYNDAYARLAGERHPALLGSQLDENGPAVAPVGSDVVREVLGGRTRLVRSQEITPPRGGGHEPAWVDIDCSPVPGEDGRPAGVFCLVTEATGRVAAERAREAAEAALADSEAQFRLMVDTVPQIIWITDGDGRMEFLNRQFSLYTGAPFSSMSPGEIAGAFIHPGDAPHVVATFQAARDKGTTHACEHRIRSADGTYRWFLDRAEPYRDPQTGEITRWFGTSVDIHDRRAAEDRLRELNATLEERVAESTVERNMLATIVEGTDIMVMALDLDYTILALNQANADEFERVFGVRPQAGDNILELLAPWPHHQDEVRAGWARGMTGENVTFVEEFGDPARARPSYEINFRPLRDEAGRQIGVYQFVIDVTERLRGQAQLLEAQEALRQSQKMEAMGQLTGGVAHDFNNLLTPIVATLDLLQRQGVGSEREQRLITGAAQSAARASLLVQRLLAFARRQPLQPLALDLGDLVAGMADLVSSTTGPRIEIAVEAPPGLAMARGDPNQIEMALLNLAVNARDAMPDGGTLRIALSEERIDADHPARLPEGTYLRLGVADTGHGMDEATLARAVEPFFSTKGIGKGTGLGLSMVHGLASQLGGAMTIESQVGVGTEVVLWLPRAAVSPQAIAAPSLVGPAASAPGGRVLLVDDEIFVRMSTADMLDELGYEIVEAASAEEAARLVEAGVPFDLLVTDHLMPGMTGVELAALARRHRPDAAVLIVSGYAEIDGIDSSISRLTKPFRKEELAASLERLAQARPAERA